MCSTYSANMYRRTFIGMATKAEAVACRESHGGRIFTSADESLVIWFSWQFTLSEVFNHPSHRGISGMIE